jgi:hypothetical protein
MKDCKKNVWIRSSILILTYRMRILANMSLIFCVKSKTNWINFGEKFANNYTAFPVKIIRYRIRTNKTARMQTKQKTFLETLD